MDDRLERVLSKIDATGDCWEWTGARSSGYGWVQVDGKGNGAHRIVWELLVGPIPEGMEIDHVCRNTLCVNPDHLETVPHGVNIRRAYGRAGMNARKVACPRGHPLIGGNLAIRGHARVCRLCERNQTRERARVRRAKAKGRAV